MQDVCAMVCAQGMYAGCVCTCARTSVCVCVQYVCVRGCVQKCVQGAHARVCVQAGVRLSLCLVCSLDLTFRKAWFAGEAEGTIDCSEAISQGWHLKGGVRH